MADVAPKTGHVVMDYPVVILTPPSGKRKKPTTPPKRQAGRSDPPD